MPRRTKDQAAQTRKKILKAALDVFSRKGYSRTTIKDIADEIGLTKGAVYWHFKNKASLLADLISTEKSKSCAVPFPSAPNSVAELRAMLLSHAQMVATNKDIRKFEFFSNFQIEWSEELMAEVHEKLNELRGDPMNSFTQILCHLQEVGELKRDIDLNILSWSMFAMWIGMLRLALMGFCTFETFEQILEQNFDLVIGQHAAGKMA